MKKLWWFSRVLVLAMALYCIGGLANSPTVTAEEPGCSSTACTKQTINGACFCWAGGCDSCLVESGSTSCGHCYRNPHLD